MFARDLPQINAGSENSFDLLTSCSGYLAAHVRLNVVVPRLIAEHRDRGGASIGTVFKAIDNTAAAPIAGTFVNLADGSIFTVGNNTFQASYEGGDGNDLTLTVVP